MTLNYTLAIIFTCTLSLMHAADDESDASDNPISRLTFYTQLRSSPAESESPIIRHRLRKEQQETFSGKTWQELFNNARERRLPWLLSTITSIDPTPRIDYCDVIELCKNNEHMYKEHDFDSRKSTLDTISRMLKETNRYSAKPHISMVTIFYPETKSVHFTIPYTIISTQVIASNLKTKSEDILSDASCILSIALQNNYKQLSPIITTLVNAKILTSDQKEKRDFWVKFFHSLAREKQKELLKECNETYLGNDEYLTMD